MSETTVRPEGPEGQPDPVTPAFDWSPYGRCPRRSCGAAPGNPCQDLGPASYTGPATYQLLPHAERPLVASQPDPADGLDDADDVFVLGSTAAGWNGVNGWFGSEPDEPAEVPVCLAASRHGGICGQPAPCDESRHVEPEPVTAERRTVGLEVLTDELRAMSWTEQVPAEAKVAVVLRESGRFVLVADTEMPWTISTPGQPVKALRGLLSEMISGANRLTREDGRPTELLMPTPDVLAALSGSPDATSWTEAPAQSSSTIAAELRALAAVFDAHPDFPVQTFGLNVGQATDNIGGEQAVRRIGELLGLPVEERVREDGRRSWSVYRYGPLALGWSYLEDEAVTA